MCDLFMNMSKTMFVICVLAFIIKEQINESAIKKGRKQKNE
jgi:hypothetical protein